MKQTDFSRRDFLQQGGSALAATWTAMSLPALLTSCGQTWDEAEGQSGFSVLSPEEASELEAIAAQIIPATDTPGAREAGVVHFMDAAFGSVFARYLEPVRSDLGSVAARVHELYPNESSFAALDDTRQKAVMSAVERQPYFRRIHFMTVLGMFSHPKYGGNRDKVGWELIGFDDLHVWQPPFGHYDEEYRNAGE